MEQKEVIVFEARKDILESIESFKVKTQKWCQLEPNDILIKEDDFKTFKKNSMFLL